MTDPTAPRSTRRRNPLLGPDAVTVAPDDASDDVTAADDHGNHGDGIADQHESAPPPDVADLDRSPRTRPVARRIDPTGKHALFSTPPAAAPDQLRAGSRETGRSAFYSTGSRQVGTVVIECAACTTRTRVTLVDLGIRFLSISAWIPGRSHSHWMRCPACDTHSWCRVAWTD